VVSKGVLTRILLLSAIVIVTGCACTPTPPPPSQDDLQTSAPEEQGVDSTMLNQMMDVVDEMGLPIDSVVVVRHGHIVFEAYPNPRYGPQDKHLLYSVTKSFTSALIGIAIEEGFLINNQDGTFRDETSTRLPQSDNSDPWIPWLSLLDLNADTHLDVVAAPLGGQEPLFYLDNGDGIFQSLPNVFNIGTDNLLAFLDIDQDGFLDVLWAWGDGTYHIVRSLRCPAID
jgi:hypothetical protein